MASTKNDIDRLMAAAEADGLVYNNADSLKATAVTVNSNYGNTLAANAYGANVVTVTAASRKTGISITGNAKNNVIVGGSGADTLGGGTGNDTLTGGSGADIFVYTAGNDVITDYAAGQDSIKVSASIGTYSLSGSDAIFKIGSNTLKVKGGKTSAIAVVNSAGSVSTYQNGLIYNAATTAKATAVTVTAGYGNKISDSVYGSNVATITAASRTKAINIVGNTQNNYIVGGSANDTLAGSKGNDTLTGGNGKDLFIYAAGNDVITDFTAGQDTIRATVGAVGEYQISGNDAIFKIGSLGTITVKNGKSTAVTIVDSSKKAATYQNAMIYNNANASKANSVTITGAASDTIGGTDYGTAIVTLDASGRTKAINLTGNAKANKIIGGIGNDTLQGGKGNDTFYGGSGNDVFIYANGEGNEVIADYAAGEDTIQIASGSISSYVVKSNDLTLKIGSGSLKIVGGKNKALTITDADKNTTTYLNGLLFDNVSTTKATAVTVGANYGATLNASTAATNVTSISAAGRTVATRIIGNSKDNVITGTSKNDVIDGGAGDDTLIGGAGNDTLTGGSGKNVFVYSNGEGNDVITDYTSGQDTIKIASGSVGTYTVSGNDAILKVGSGAMTLKGVGNNDIIIADAEDNPRIYRNGLIYAGTSIARSKALTVTAAYAGDLSSYGANVVSIDASARKTAVEIVGNAANNYISGGTAADTLEGGDGDDTLVGGKGSDTLTGGDGKDVFLYTSGDGNDVITDYTSGEDIISLAGNYPINYSVNSSDAFIKIGTGVLTLKGAASAAITVVGANEIATLCSGGKTKAINDPDAPSDVLFDSTTTSKATAATITSDYKSTVFAASKYASLETIDASFRTALNISGNGLNNVIYVGNGNASIDGGVGDDTIYAATGNYTLIGGAGNDYIYGGIGNSTLNGGAGDDTLIGSTGNTTMTGGAGNDVFVYSSDTTYAIITDFAENQDKIQLEGITTVNSGMVSGSDVVFSFGDGILRIKSAKDKKVSIRSGNVEAEYLNGVYVDNSPESEGITVTLSSAFNGSFDLDSYNSILNEPATNINASLATNPNTLYGNDDINFIWAGVAGSQIYTGKGDDYVYGGDGVDTLCFYEDDGSDSVYNYATGDIIYLATGSKAQFKNISLEAADVIINLTSNEKLTLRNAREQRIYIQDFFEDSVDAIYSNTFGKVSVEGTSVTLDADYVGTFRPNYYANSVVDIDASRVNSSLSVYGTDAANIISTGDVGLSIFSGAGSDTIFSGNGYDSIRYESGNEYIYNYKTGDFIDFGTNNTNLQFSYVSFNDNDVILNLKGGNRITLKEAKDQRIHIRGNNPDAFDYNSTFGKVTFDSSGTAILSSDYAGTFNPTQYTNAISNIDGSSVTNEIEVYGNDAANVIYGGKNYSYIYAGAGNDTIYCGTGGGYVDGGAGNDLISLSGSGSNAIRYMEGGGNDTVHNYQAGDYVYLSSDDPQFQGVSLNENDIVINLVSGNNITLIDARYKNIRINDRQNSRDTEYESTFGNVSIAANSIILNPDYSGTFNLSYYADSPAMINAFNVVNAIEIYGDARDNLIYAGKADCTINAGAGDDTITCGNGVDVIQYYADGGSDVIRDMENGDKLYTNNAQVSSASVSGSNIVLTTISDKTITIENAARKSILINDMDFETYAANLSTDTTSGGEDTTSGGEDTTSGGGDDTIEAESRLFASSADILWFADDDNFITGNDLDSLIDGDSFGGLSLGAYNNDSIQPFAQDTPAFNYSYTDKK